MKIVFAVPIIAIGADDFHRLAWLAETVRLRLPKISAFLHRELNRAKVVDPWFGLVTMGTTVCYRVDGSAAEHIGRLVYPADVQRHDNAISILSELGAALIGLREGQSIYWKEARGGLRSVTVIRAD